jgi:radical S-adenosyl methionine domain-containing protein 2
MKLVFNWHITQRCNYSCHYCFSEWHQCSEIWQTKEIAEKLILEISDSNPDLDFMEFKMPPRLNIAGGEPLLLGRSLVKYLEKAKSGGLETSIITNGSLLKRNIEVVDNLDMMGISIDSLNHESNISIGRSCRGTTLFMEELQETVSNATVRNPSLKLKFNIVVNRFNWDTIVVEKLQEFSPHKIKILRQLPFKDQSGITDDEFLHFMNNNRTLYSNVVVEDNTDMINSYLMIDPAGRFFQNGNPAEYRYSEPIHVVGINSALKQITFDSAVFKSRYKETV